MDEKQIIQERLTIVSMLLVWRRAWLFNRLLREQWKTADEFIHEISSWQSF